MTQPVHNKSRCSASTSAESSAAPATVTVERRPAGRWSRIGITVVALMFCSLVALFIQQTRYVKRWRQLITPLDVGQHPAHSMPGMDISPEYDASSVDIVTDSKFFGAVPEEINYSGPRSFKDIQLFAPESSKKTTETVPRDDDYSVQNNQGVNQDIDYVASVDDDELEDDDIEEEDNDDDNDARKPGRTIEVLPKSYHKSQQRFSDAPRETPKAEKERFGEKEARDRMRDRSKESLFTSPLVVTEQDWPITKHLRPISLRSALGQKSSRETSATRPISVAYIRHCIQDDPSCLVHEPFKVDKHCPYPGLVRANDWNSADIVVFSVWRMRNKRFVPVIKRPPGQIWVMLSVEAPSRKTNHTQLDYTGLKGQFNLTMSFRLDSDIPYPYGYLQRGVIPRNKDFEAVYSTKRFHAAWLVSHCNTNSRRERYVRLLRTYGLQVHIYGLCGKYSCHDGKASKEGDDRAPDSVCMPHISKHYHFYLSFENTMCKDYITEKLFKVFDPVDLIPVVMGGADYGKFLPPGTYVNTADFSTARDLARYLVRLAGNKKRYVSMLREKHRWHRVVRPPWYCALGEKLATGVRPRVLHDTRTWYTHDQCWRPDE